jgi:putative chitinase
MIANRVYANRMGNGDERSGDGWKYRGRGLIQITGKNNYVKFSEFMGISLEKITEYMETYDGAMTSACWFWDLNALNTLADTGNIKEMTKKINGGYNGLEDRLNKYNMILEIIK